MAMKDQSLSQVVRCTYHGVIWCVLVESGWITAAVEDGNLAVMVYCPARPAWARSF